MKKFGSLSALFFFVCLSMVSFSAETGRIALDFSGATAEANQVTLMGAGFGAYPQADVTFGAVPTDNAFENATDGKGMIVQADPGEGVMVLTPSIQTSHCALIRCSVRISSPNVSIYLATIDQSESVYVSTLTPTNPSSFIGQYRRIADFFLPPSSGFQGIIQILNTGSSETVTVYLDNLEILILDKDNIDLAVTEITGKQTITVNLDLPADAKPLEMVLIPAGMFMMGSPGSEPNRSSDESPQHLVTISQPFYMGKYEVTQAQWQAVMGSNPSKWKGNNLPVEQISWNNCQAFIQKLNQLGQGTFRLPTEAEWEYACRGKSTTAFYWGEDSSYSQIGQYAWYDVNSGSKTHEVGTKSSNGYGLFDMSGNVWEWCQDWYGSYSTGTHADPTGAVNGSNRVYRGGGWNYVAWCCRSAFRDGDIPDYAIDVLGFRLVLVRT